MARWPGEALADHVMDVDGPRRRNDRRRPERRGSGRRAGERWFENPSPTPGGCSRSSRPWPPPSPASPEPSPRTPRVAGRAAGRRGLPRVVLPPGDIERPGRARGGQRRGWRWGAPREGARRGRGPCRGRPRAAREPGLRRQGAGRGRRRAPGRARPSSRTRSSGCGSASPQRGAHPREAKVAYHRPVVRQIAGLGRHATAPRRPGRGRGRGRSRSAPEDAPRGSPGGMPTAANASKRGRSGPTRPPRSSHSDRRSRPPDPAAPPQGRPSPRPATPLLAADVREVGGHDADRPDRPPTAQRASRCPGSTSAYRVPASGWSTPAGSTWSSSAARGAAHEPVHERRVATGAHCPTSRTRPSRRSRDRRAKRVGRAVANVSPVHSASSAGWSTRAPSTFRIETSWSVTTSARSAATNRRSPRAGPGGRVATRPGERARPARSRPGCSS